MSAAPLRICFLTYRGNPHCGGQGIYTRHLTRELAALGHTVEVWSGPPYPRLDAGVPLRRIPSLDLWDPDAFFRRPTFAELFDRINRKEWLSTVTGGFPEPVTFTRRAAREYAGLPAAHRYDVVHDNQSLGDGLLRLRRYAPVLATIHHPITVDRDIALQSAPTRLKQLGVRRWYSFIPRQLRVAAQLDLITTVSQASAADIARDFGIGRERIRVIENGVDLDVFSPQRAIPRRPDVLISTISATAPLKGFRFLLEAFAELRSTRRELTLKVVGQDGHAATNRRIRELGLEGAVRFTGALTDTQIAQAYAEATIAVVPSLYEGFGLPAAEAMACEVPVVSTRAGALPEVVGNDGSAGVLVPPAESASLARSIAALLDAPERRRRMGVAGRQRVASLFSWRRSAQRMGELYVELLAARKRMTTC
jgi:glycosyltransferase involved in cell wall biosynthesis